jgi:hypothetical protein
VSVILGPLRFDHEGDAEAFADWVEEWHSVNVRDQDDSFIQDVFEEWQEHLVRAERAQGEPDGECFRGREYAAYEAAEMARVQRDLK